MSLMGPPGSVIKATKEREISAASARPDARIHLSQDVNRADRIFRWILAGAALSLVLLLVGLSVQLGTTSWQAVEHFGLSFLTGREWDPVHEQFGGAPFLFGTVVSSLVALSLAVPVGLGSAIYLSELAPRALRPILGALIELLAAVPSVVYGLWGLEVLAPLLRNTVEPFLSATLGFLPLFQGPHQGVGMLAGGIILAIMILPTIASVSREVLQAVPLVIREGALALGATRWAMIWKTVLPVASSGIMGAILLGLGRALGETMAVTMLIGNKASLSASLFAPSYTMASVIANEFSEAEGDLHLSALAEIALLLFAVTLLLNLAGRLLIWSVQRKMASGRM